MIRILEELTETYSKAVNEVCEVLAQELNTLLNKLGVDYDNYTIYMSGINFGQDEEKYIPMPMVSIFIYNNACSEEWKQSIRDKITDKQSELNEKLGFVIITVTFFDEYIDFFMENKSYESHRYAISLKPYTI